MGDNVRELEITVKVNSNYEKLHRDLIKNGFKIVDKYSCYDTYMIDSNIDTRNMRDLDIISKCVIVRDIIPYTKLLTYKKKTYDEFDNIIEQSKIDVKIDDIDNAIKFMKTINYKKLIDITDNLIVYSNNLFDIAVQLVNDKYIFIEMENEAQYGSKKYSNIKDMIRDFETINIDYDNSNYFVKKAQIVLNER